MYKEMSNVFEKFVKTCPLICDFMKFSRLIRKDVLFYMERSCHCSCHVEMTWPDEIFTYFILLKQLLSLLIRYALAKMLI